MSSSLITALQGIEDFRAAKGKRYPLWVILLLIILGTMSECFGYKALEDFCVRHHQALCEYLGLEFKRLPSDTTFRNLFQNLNFERLMECFQEWANREIGVKAGEWICVDGKSIKSTLVGANDSYQNFINIVSVYSKNRGVVLAMKQFENKNGSEIQVVETLLNSLNVKGVIFSLDALHCQKKLSYQ